MPVLFFLLAVLLACPHPVTAAEVLMMATTTSTDNTGLLDQLAPALARETGIELRWVAVGTGKALELGRNCDVDVLLVHAPAAEKAFMAGQYGRDRRRVMHNDFVMIGPAADPAGIRGLDPALALKKIRDHRALFLSRGDNSGTHKKEGELWHRAGIRPPERSDWYLETGQGMLRTLNMAAEKQGYTLSDRGTWIKYSSKNGPTSGLVILVQGDPALFNQYSVITVNPDTCPGIRYRLATRFSDWLVSPATQKLIGDFRLLGQSLFIPDAR